MLSFPSQDGFFFRLARKNKPGWRQTNIFFSLALSDQFGMLMRGLETFL